LFRFLQASQSKETDGDMRPTSQRTTITSKAGVTFSKRRRTVPKSKGRRKRATKRKDEAHRRIDVGNVVSYIPTTIASVEISCAT
jgi:hypothetical protein